MKIELVIPGTPIGKERARCVKKGAHTVLYTPAKTVNYEKRVKRVARIQLGAFKLLTGPIRLTVHAQFEPPKRAVKRTHHLTRPDVDNVVKSCFDALQGVVYADDKQVVELHARKDYGPEPLVEITIEEIMEERLPT
jgi:Holliday junction resolvase RusA-like endonuclease